MRIYIVEDDISVISILEDIVESNDLGTVCGDSGSGLDLDKILALAPDLAVSYTHLEIRKFSAQMLKNSSALKAVPRAASILRSHRLARHRMSCLFFPSKPMSSFVYRPGGQPVLLYHVFVLLPRNTLLHQLVYGIKKRLRGTRRRLKG